MVGLLSGLTSKYPYPMEREEVAALFGLKSAERVRQLISKPEVQKLIKELTK
jgi:hypothetical protein